MVSGNTVHRVQLSFCWNRWYWVRSERLRVVLGNQAFLPHPDHHLPAIGFIRRVEGFGVTSGEQGWQNLLHAPGCAKQLVNL